MRGKAPAVAVLERYRDAFALAKGGRDRVGQAAPVRLGRGQTVDHDQHLGGLAHRLLGVGLIEADDGAVQLGAHEPGGAQLRRDVDVRPMRAGGKGKRDQDW